VLGEDVVMDGSWVIPDGPLELFCDALEIGRLTG